MIKRGKCVPSKACGWICCSGCERLTSDFKCGIQASKPYGCRVYPHNPMALEKGCTYYFEEGGVKITPENVYSFPEEKRRAWLELFIEKSEDEG